MLQKSCPQAILPSTVHGMEAKSCFPVPAADVSEEFWGNTETGFVLRCGPVVMGIRRAKGRGWSALEAGLLAVPTPTFMLSRLEVHFDQNSQHTLVLYRSRPCRVKGPRLLGKALQAAQCVCMACLPGPAGSHSLMFSLGNQESLLPPCRNGHSAESGKVHKSQVSFLSSFLFLLTTFVLSHSGVIIFYFVFYFLEQTLMLILQRDSLLFVW